MAPTFDQIGPLTKTVADMACVLDVAVEQKPNIAYSKKITEALATAAALEKQTSWRFVRLKASFVLILERSFGTGT